MHFSATYLTLALSLASSVLAMPQQENYLRQTTTTSLGENGYGARTTTTGPYVPGSTGGARVHPECMMFGPYVPPALLEAVCSLHMTPLGAGVVQSFPSSCLNPVAGQGGNTLLNEGTTLNLQQNQYNGNSRTTSNYNNQRTTTTDGYAVEATTTASRLAGGYGQATTTTSAEGSTTTGGYGGQVEEVEEE
ncbi:MAG: hypothetical protein L6R40_004304 [Gallowayella cf. fulva]|nr:MAG: hypothetical protein L6R40_004304 [Xanthomendoza cf. fulva]